MKRIIAISAFVILALSTAHAFAGDVYVDGYYRSNGTYVRPHYRSAPDGIRSNNYGPSQTDSHLLNPRSRDNDQDGTPNYLDQDDDNDGLSDNNDSNQYGGR
jgi:hypothetical protein